MASYCLVRSIVELLTGAFSAVGLVAAGFVIHSVWNDATYPLVGYFTGKPPFLTGRWGRRFPWIAVGAEPPIGVPRPLPEL